MHKQNEFKDSTSSEASFVNDRDDGGALVEIHGWKGVDEQILDFDSSFHMIPNKDLFSTYEKVNGGNITLDNNDTYKIVGLKKWE